MSAEETTNESIERKATALRTTELGAPRQVTSFDASCHGSLGSNCSHQPKLDKFKLMLAELKARQLKETHEFEMRALEERQRRDLLKAHHELELARLAEEVADDQSVRSSINNVRLDKVRQFVSDTGNQANGIAFTGNEGDPAGLRTAVYDRQSLKSVGTAGDLPRVELFTFDGSSTSYWKFIKQFEHYVVSKVQDDGQRLLYLLHYCRGKARVAIEECVMLPPSAGYCRAREILRELFGQTHVVARSLLENLLKGVDFNDDVAESLSHLAVKMENCAIALEQMDYVADLNSLVTLEKIVRKLPGYLQHQWAVNVDEITSQSREPSFADLTKFVSSKARVARSRFGQLACENRKKTSPSIRHSCTKNTGFSCAVSGSTESKGTCPVCPADHPLVACPTFLAMSVSDRWKCAKEKGLCFSCLKGSHRVRRCERPRTCNVDGCQRQHHRLLHSAKETSPISAPIATGQCTATGTTSGGVSLGLVPVKLRFRDRELKGYALLDSGSDTTLISKDAANDLGMELHGEPTVLKTVGGVAHSSTVSCGFELLSIDGKETIKVESAVIVPGLPIHKSARATRQQVKQWPHLTDLPFEHTHDGEVCILIGCDVPEAHWGIDQRLGGRKQPFAVRTLLGWVAYGPLGTGERRQFTVNRILADTESPENLLRQMYDSEFADAQAMGQTMSAEEAGVMRIVETGATFNDGNFTIPMPWKNGRRPAFSNYILASARIKHLERKLRRDKDLRQRYSNAMQKILDRGYAKEVPATLAIPDHRPRWYLPHHAVINPKKPEKLRVVLDCAAKCNGRSLNDFLHSGPDITSSLVSVLLRFRIDRIAVVADIEEMFMQVKVPEEDQGTLRYLWWPHGDLTAGLKEYQMTRHPFGATSSPFCANFALRKTAQTFGARFDAIVTQAVESNFYVDDCLISFPTVEEAIRFGPQIDALLRCGGFLLKKWASNSDDVIKSLPNPDPATSPVTLPYLPQTGQRALGIEWNTGRDVFNFRFNITERPKTRRGILSVVSSLFDPLGLVAPICLPAKQLLQRICKAGAGWDQPLPDEDITAWGNWVAFVQRLEDIEVDRTIRRTNPSQISNIELHVFCDASESGYGAVAYARCVVVGSDPYCVLLFSKSRVAPLKAVTVPRLELAAAVLGVKISRIVKDGLPDFFHGTYFWTDSMIVLYYIRDTATRFSVFVTNRLAVIHEFSTADQWRHIASGQNPADYSSRGITSTTDLARWIRGPAFLHDAAIETEPPCCDDPPKEIELKRPSAHVAVSAIERGLDSLLVRYSEWTRLLKAVAWLMRFIRYMHVKYGREKRDSLKTGDLSVFDLDAATHQVLAMIQRATYGSVIKQLRSDSDRVKPTNCTLAKLCPIVQNGLLCVGGRLGYSDYPREFKHPIILPNRHFVTSLIIQYYHKVEGHSGPSHVLAEIRKRYWIVKGGSAVKRVIGGCMTCRRLFAVAGQQMMAPLPLCRIQRGWSCFASVGVDFFGPFLVRRGRGTEKRYGCLFTCLQTRAVHLEVAASLSTDSFIMVLMRFIARRGNPREIYSDNGTNFVGAVSELKQFVERWDKRKISDRMLSRSIQWHFNPSSASHRGGVWERMIRSVRKLLLSISTAQLMTDETLLTYLVEVERILNNRPIVPLLSSDKDTTVLSPSSLLLLRDNEGIPTGATMCDNYSRRWRQVNYLAEVFWRRWLREYLPTLQSRQKWISKARNFKRNDVVLMLSTRTARGKWPLGVIESSIPDRDGLVRTVLVRTGDGVVARDVRKVCLLEGAE